MLDQNVAVILAATIGGLLTIAGGIAANFYLLNRTIKLEKRKELRNVLEELYGCIAKNNTAINSIRYDKSLVSNEILAMNAGIDRILVLLDLYLPFLSKEYRILSSSFLLLANTYRDYRDDKIDLKEYNAKVEEYRTTIEVFRKRLVSLAKQKDMVYSG